MTKILEALTSDPDHITTAKHWAEQLSNMPSDKAMEQLNETKEHWIRILQKDIESIKNI